MRWMGAVMIGSGGDASVSEVIEAALPYYDTLIWGMIPVTSSVPSSSSSRA